MATKKDKVKEILSTAFSTDEKIDYGSFINQNEKVARPNIESLPLQELLSLFKTQVKELHEEENKRSYHKSDKYTANFQFLERLIEQIDLKGGYREILVVFTQLNTQDMLEAVREGLLTAFLAPVKTPTYKVKDLDVILDFIKQDKSAQLLNELEKKSQKSQDISLYSAKVNKETMELIKDQTLNLILNQTFLSKVLQSAHFLKRMHADYINYKHQFSSSVEKYKHLDMPLDMSLDIVAPLTPSPHSPTLRLDEDSDEADNFEDSELKDSSYKEQLLEYPKGSDPLYQEKHAAYEEQRRTIDFFEAKRTLLKLNPLFISSDENLESQYFNYDYFYERLFDSRYLGSYRDGEIEKKDVTKNDYENVVQFLYANVLNTKSLEQLKHKGLTCLYNFCPSEEKALAYEPYLGLIESGDPRKFYSNIYEIDRRSGYSSYSAREKFSFTNFNNTSLNYNESLFPWAAEILDNVNYKLNTPEQIKLAQEQILSICLSSLYGLDNDGYRRQDTGFRLFKLLNSKGKAIELLSSMNVNDVVDSMVKARISLGSKATETCQQTIEFFEQLKLDFNAVKADKWVALIKLIPELHTKLEHHKESVYANVSALESIIGYHGTHREELAKIDNAHLFNIEKADLINKMVWSKPDLILDEGFAKYMNSDLGAGFLPRLTQDSLKNIEKKYKSTIENPQWWSEVMDAKKISAPEFKKLKSIFPVAFKDKSLKAKYYCNFFSDYNYNKIPPSVWQSSDILVSMMEYSDLINEDKFFPNVAPSMWSSQKFVLKVMELFDSGDFVEKRFLPSFITTFLAKAGVKPGNYMAQMEAVFDKANLEFMLSNPGQEKGYYLIEEKKDKRGYGEPAPSVITFVPPIPPKDVLKNKKTNKPEPSPNLVQVLPLSAPSPDGEINKTPVIRKNKI